jgi:multiple sugar transport system substrate-binding protein
MNKNLCLFILLILVFTSACGSSIPTPAAPTATTAPTETVGPDVRFLTPQDGATLPMEALDFQIEPVPGAEGYALVFLQNGKILWDTFRDESRLLGVAYSIPVGGVLNGVLSPGELLVQGKARVDGVWTEPTTLTLQLAQRVPTPTPTPPPTATLPPRAVEPVEIRWFVGLGGGTSQVHQAYERNMVSRFNATHPNLKLTLQVVEDIPRARELLMEQFRNGTGPDIVGPMGFQASNAFPDQWFDLSALVADASYDLSIFQPELLDMYRTDAGLVGLPFMVYPAAVFYNKSLFDAAHIAYPPDAYGKKYQMPDGSQVEWNWDTLAQVARALTLDAQGRNANDPDFDSAHIVQFGFIPQWECITCFASFWQADRLYDQSNSPVIPAPWRDAWKWYHDGMWGARPFIPSQAALSTAHFGNGGGFNSAYVAMAISQSWYIGSYMAGGLQWDMGALPATTGVVHGRIDADSIRIWKFSPHPREAFDVLAYLLGPDSADLMRALGGIPPITSRQDAVFRERAQQYGFVRNWAVLKDGLNYPDIPSGEGYMPNFLEGWDRLLSFGNLLASNGTISVDAEIGTLQHDLEGIFKR